jgi:hypothetical protein
MLTDLADRVHLAKNSTNLTTHITDIVNLILYEDLRGIVLVGHSYAATVVTAVADPRQRRSSGRWQTWRATAGA